MVLKNPCNTCLVKPACKFNCDLFQQFLNSRLKTKFFIELICLISYVSITVIPTLLYMSDKPHIQVLLTMLMFPTIISTGVWFMIKVEELLDKYYLPYMHRRDYL